MNRIGSCAIAPTPNAHPAWLVFLGTAALAIARQSWPRQGQRPLAVLFGIVALVALLAAGARAQDRLAGDCNNDGRVTVGEIITLVNIDLGTADPSACYCPPQPHGVFIPCALEAIDNLLFAPLPIVEQCGVGCSGDPSRCQVCWEVFDCGTHAIDFCNDTPEQFQRCLAALCPGAQP